MIPSGDQGVYRLWRQELAHSPIVKRARAAQAEAERAPPPEIRAPYEEYANRPNDFVRDVLGMNPWERCEGMPAEYASQAEILAALADHRRVAAKAGQKVGKSGLGAWAALWWLNTRVQGRVTLTAPSAHQVDSILWTEIRLIAQGQHPAQRAASFIPRLPGINMPWAGGRLYTDPHSGLVLGDAWDISSVTTDKPTRMQGRSGSRQLYIVDEASGYPEEIFSAILGNLAGGGSILLLGNPTELAGTFYEAFHQKAEIWTTFTQSSLQNPNFYGLVIDGMANEDYAATALVDWGGPGNPLYDARVLGRFPSAGENVVVPLALVETSQGRWKATLPEGRMEIGVDPSEGGDAAILAPRRGKKVFPLEAIPIDPKNPDMKPGHQIGAYVYRFVSVYNATRDPSEPIPRIKIDAIGDGTSAFDYLWALEGRGKEFEVVGVVSSEAADAWVRVRHGRTAKEEYANLRAQIGFGVRDFLHEGGSLPPDGKLHAELVAAKYYFKGSKQIIELKKEIKKRLKRSPDRADALALSVYEPPRAAPTTKPPAVQTHEFGSSMGWG